MKKVAVIGAGVSGLAMANLLKGKYHVKVFEKESRSGGLVKCDRINGDLYHMVGGHVFNSKRDDVLDFFWRFFNKESEFVESVRNAVAYIDKPIGYPVENNIFEFPSEMAKSIIEDLLEINRAEEGVVDNFEDFLKGRFGKTLYQNYFKPYNEKIWKCSLSEVPISWLEGKLPMPTVHEILYNNISRWQETKMVHSRFYYPKNNGSQFLVERMAEGLDVQCNSVIDDVRFDTSARKWHVGEEVFDKVIFTGNIRSLPSILNSQVNIDDLNDEISRLPYHGTTSVLCRVDDNPYSWIYLPDREYQSHRIINTGNFSINNNGGDYKTATVEFTDYVGYDEIIASLSKMPFSPHYIAHQYTEFTYPVQNANTRCIIDDMKERLEKEDFFLLGRFAEWEYYNMDAAIGAAIDLYSRSF